VISRFHVSGYQVQSPLLVQLHILNSLKASDRRFMIFLDPTAQIESCFHDSRILTVVFSDLYSLRVSEMPRSHHVSSLMDGPTISRFRDFVSQLFSCALQRTKPPESDGYRSSALNLTDENLLPFLCAPRPF
jgi:hypothetical protein